MQSRMEIKAHRVWQVGVVHDEVDNNGFQLVQCTLVNRNWPCSGEQEAREGAFEEEGPRTTEDHDKGGSAPHSSRALSL